jgi:hypothetical protein
VSTLEALHSRVDALELEVRGLRLASDPDRMLSVKEIAQVIGKKPGTILKNWLPNPYTRRKWMVHLLLKRDPAGRYFSTPRQIAIWQRAISEGLSC